MSEHDNNMPEMLEPLNGPVEKVAVIGCGNWGKNLVRNFHNLGHLDIVCDQNEDSLQALAKLHPDIRITTDYQMVLDNPHIYGVVIATPSHTHYPLAKQAIMAGKHVYVEKPVATNSQHTIELFTLAEEMERILMVGHLLMYHPVINRLRQLIQEGVLGDILSVQSDRLNINKFRPDKSVMWDLAPHDLSMMMYLLDKEPDKVVSSVGYTNHEDGLIDDMHADITFPGNNGESIGGHIHVSWVHPMKQVKLIVHGTKFTAVIDDTVSENKLKLFKADSNTPEEYPEYLQLEPLKMECQHFINCMRSGKKPKSDGINGFKVVRVLEDIEEAMQVFQGSHS